MVGALFLEKDLLDFGRSRPFAGWFGALFSEMKCPRVPVWVRGGRGAKAIRAMPKCLLRYSIWGFPYLLRGASILQHFLWSSNSLWSLALALQGALSIAMGDRFWLFIQTLNNDKKPFNSIFNSKTKSNYSFKEFIHSKTKSNYSFKEFIHSKIR